MQQVKQTWKDRAIQRAEIITDAWEVTKVWAGRAAEWILFICMVINIIEILPGAGLSLAFQNFVLCVQAVTLDVAGFSLATMGDHARAAGNIKAGRLASNTGNALIGIMLLTLILVSVGLLWPQWLWLTAFLEKILILVRVAMTVVYSHVIHKLRRQGIEALAAEKKEQEKSIEKHVDEIAKNLQTSLQQRQDESLERFATWLENRLQSGLEIAQKNLADAQENWSISFASQFAEMARNEIANSFHFTDKKLTNTDELLAIELPAEDEGQDLAEQDDSEIEDLDEGQPEQPAARPRLHVVAPAKRPRTAGSQAKTNPKDFVFSCFDRQPGAKLEDIQKLAKKRKIDLSISTICRYKKEYLANRNESSDASENANEMQA
jgi:HAMP domain-containing protein